MEGKGDNGLVIGDSGNSRAKAKETYVKESGKRTWTTVLECISATSKSLIPAIIFKG